MTMFSHVAAEDIAAFHRYDCPGYLRIRKMRKRNSVRDPDRRKERSYEDDEDYDGIPSGYGHPVHQEGKGCDAGERAVGEVLIPQQDEAEGVREAL